MEPNAKSRVLDMTRGSALPLLLRFAMPLFCGNLLQQFYNLADTSLAGHILGDAALSQIGATAALYSLITNFAFGLNNGLALTVSRFFGAGEKENLRRAVCWMLLLSGGTALLLTGGFLAFSGALPSLLQIPAGAVQGAMQYLVVIFAGIPLTMAYNLEASLLQAVGNSLTPLGFLLFSTVLNVLLDVLFMGTLGLGVQGAAAATVLAQGVSALLGLWYICRHYAWLRFGKVDAKASLRFVVSMYSGGLSMALMSAIYNLGSVVLQTSINALGEVYIAAQVAARRLAELFYMPGTALGTAIATYTSQNYGAGKRSRILKGVWASLLLYGVWWVVALLFTFTLSAAAVQLITGARDAAVIQNAVLYLKISIPMIPPMAVLVILRNMMQGLQHILSPLICSSLEMIGKIFFALFLVPSAGYIAVCICEPVTWVICLAFILAAVFLCRKDFRDLPA